MTRALTLGLILITAGLALALRCPSLDRRPMHNDEAVNAVKFGQLWEKGIYRYDPNEHHGPSLYYATVALAGLTRAPDFEHFTEARLRLLTLIFGVGLILLLPLLRDALGKGAALWAGILTAVSPAMVFYSRYYIHEILLVFFTFLALAAGWRYWRSRKSGWALLGGAAAGLMHATKETFVITLGAAALALFVNQTWNRLLDASGDPAKAPRINFKHLLAGAAIWVLVWVILFSSFFTNASGLLDSLRTYLPWFSRAGGESPHIHPWSFYLHRLLFFQVPKGPAWSEALILALGLIGALAAFARKGLADANPSFVRFLGLYTLLLTVFYSLLPYKTPWCLLNFWQPMILLAGVGIVVICRAMRPRLLLAAVSATLVASAAHLGWQAWRASVPFSADSRNPYVYAQTSPDILNLIEQVEALAKVSPQGRQMVVKVMAPESDYWPLPWYLRGFKNIGWWAEIPDDPFAPVMIVSSKFHAELDEKKTHLMPRYYELRPQIFFELYVEVNLWRAYLRIN